MRNTLFFINLLLLLLLQGCSSKTNEVVVYTTVDQLFSEPILKDFEKETGIHVKAVYDTEETKSTGVLNRLIAEKDNPQCDVFWSGDPVRTIVLKNKGITQPFTTKTNEDINPIFKDPEGHWAGFSARARVLIYNKDRLSEKDVPHSILDLTQEQYKGQVAIANPLFGTTTFHLAALFTALGDARAKAWMEKLKENNLVVATSNGDVKKRVAQGSVSCGLTDTDDAYEALKEGANIGIVFLDQEGIGTLVMPNLVNRITGSKNPVNAQKLLEYLLSKDTEAKLAQSCAQMPLHHGVETPKDIPSLGDIKPMNINYNDAAKKLEEIQNYLKTWVED